jgi:hypothetical protein
MDNAPPDTAARLGQSDDTWTLSQKLLSGTALLGVFGAFQIYPHRAEVAHLQ